MIIPKYLKSDEKSQIKIENMIMEILCCDYIKSYPIEEFENDDLKLLSEYAKVNNILITIRAEYSNIHQGILVCLIRKDIIEIDKVYIKFL